MSLDKPMTVMCLASFEKGNDFIREAKAQGCRVLLLTLEKLKDRPWPWEAIDELFLMPTFDDPQGLINAVSYHARTNQIDRIVPMDDYDVERAASIREHLRLPGMGDTTARHFRDKLAMRMKAREEGVLVPEFVPIINYDRIREFMARVPPPWMLKPRMEAAAVGIKKIQAPDELWPELDRLGDRQSYFLLEKYVSGSVYHVDALTFNREILLAESHRYGRPPFDVVHAGGLLTSRTLPRGSREERDVLDVHANVLRGLNFVRGVTHSEFIRGADDGKFYFLETSARVCGAYLANMVEASCGVNLWREWAKIEIAGGKGDYRTPAHSPNYGGLIISLARQEWPDTSAYNDPEIVYRVVMRHHAGLILSSKNQARVDGLLESYVKRYFNDFVASMPAPDKVEH